MNEKRSALKKKKKNIFPFFREIDFLLHRFRIFGIAKVMPANGLRPIPSAYNYFPAIERSGHILIQLLGTRQTLLVIPTLESRSGETFVIWSNATIYTFLLDLPALISLDLCILINIEKLST